MTSPIFVSQSGVLNSSDLWHVLKVWKKSEKYSSNYLTRLPSDKILKMYESIKKSCIHKTFCYIYIYIHFLLTSAQLQQHLLYKYFNCVNMPLMNINNLYFCTTWRIDWVVWKSWFNSIFIYLDLIYIFNLSYKQLFWVKTIKVVSYFIKMTPLQNQQGCIDVFEDFIWTLLQERWWGHKDMSRCHQQRELRLNLWNEQQPIVWLNKRVNGKILFQTWIKLYKVWNYYVLMVSLIICLLKLLDVSMRWCSSGLTGMTL